MRTRYKTVEMICYRKIMGKIRRDGMRNQRIREGLKKEISGRNIIEDAAEMGTKTSQGKCTRTDLVPRGWATHSPWQCSPAHRGCCKQNTSRLWVGSVTSCALQSTHESIRLRFIPRMKRTYAWTTFFFSGRNFYRRHPSYSTHELKWCLGWNNNACQTFGLSHWESRRQNSGIVNR